MDVSDRTLATAALGVAVLVLLVLAAALAAPGRVGLAGRDDARERVEAVQAETEDLALAIDAVAADLERLRVAQDRVEEQVLVVKRGPRGPRGAQGPRGPRGAEGSVDGIDLIALAERVGEAVGEQRRQRELIAGLNRELRISYDRLRALEAGRTG